MTGQHALAPGPVPAWARPGTRAIVLVGGLGTFARLPARADCGEGELLSLERCQCSGCPPQPVPPSAKVSWRSRTQDRIRAPPGLGSSQGQLLAVAGACGLDLTLPCCQRPFRPGPLPLAVLAGRPSRDAHTGSFWEELAGGGSVWVLPTASWTGPRGTVRTCLEMVASLYSQRFFVTHMPSPALSSSPTGRQKKEQLYCLGDTHVRVAARRTSPGEQRSTTCGRAWEESPGPAPAGLGCTREYSRDRGRVSGGARPL